MNDPVSLEPPNQTRTVPCAGRSRLLPHALLLALATASLLVADPAFARKAKGGLATGIHSPHAAQVAQARAAALAPETTKPLPHPRGHGPKQRGASR